MGVLTIIFFNFDLKVMRERLSILFDTFGFKFSHISYLFFTGNGRDVSVKILFLNNHCKWCWFYSSINTFIIFQMTKDKRCNIGIIEYRHTWLLILLGNSIKPSPIFVECLLPLWPVKGFIRCWNITKPYHILNVVSSSLNYKGSEKTEGSTYTFVCLYSYTM